VACSDASLVEASARRRRDLLAQLERLQDFCVMGDLTRGQYTMRRQALEQEVERIGPSIDPDLDRAEALLDEFAGFWEIEHDPAEPPQMLGQLFDRVWQDDGVIVAVRPRAPFARYFATVADIQAIGEMPETPTGDPRCKWRERRGVKPTYGTPSRFGSDHRRAPPMSRPPCSSPRMCASADNRVEGARSRRLSLPRGRSRRWRDPRESG
jgi:hypothetical protein